MNDNSLVNIRRYSPSIDIGLLEFQIGKTIIHIGSVDMVPLFPKEDFLQKFGTDGIYLAVAGDAVVGAMQIAVEQEDFSRFALIYGIKVDVPWRRKGIGLQLMQQADIFTREKGLDKIVLDTRADNIPALSLYKKCGFTVVRKSGSDLRLEKVCRS